MSDSLPKYVDFRVVKAAVTIEQVLARYGLSNRFRRTGDALRGPCPIREGSTIPDMVIASTKGTWACQSDCQCSGNVLDFVAKMEGVDPLDAARLLVRWFDVKDAEIFVGRKPPKIPPQH